MFPTHSNYYNYNLSELISRIVIYMNIYGRIPKRVVFIGCDQKNFTIFYTVDCYTAIKKK